MGPPNWLAARWALSEGIVMCVRMNRVREFLRAIGLAASRTNQESCRAAKQYTEWGETMLQLCQEMTETEERFVIGRMLLDRAVADVADAHKEYLKTMVPNDASSREVDGREETGVKGE